MSRWGLSPVVLVAFLVVAATITVRAADWPQWGGGDARNMASDEKDVLYVASQQYLWAVQLTKPHGLVSVPIQRRHADHRSHS